MESTGDSDFTAVISPRAEDDDFPDQYGKRTQIGELTLYADDDGYWVNHVEVHDRYRRRGIAAMLIKAACKRHGTIYFSRQTKDQCTDDDDTRYMTEDGAALATRLAASTDPDINVKVAMPGSVKTAPPPPKKTEKKKEKSEESDDDNDDEQMNEWLGMTGAGTNRSKKERHRGTHRLDTI